MKRLVALLLSCCSLSVLPRAGHADEDDSERTSLTSRLGLRVAERLLSSGEQEDRLLALERLGQVGTAKAVQLLVGALERDGTARGPAERLTAVRALAPHCRWPATRQTLIRVLNGALNKGSESPELEDMTRRSAALALASNGSPESLTALGQALKGVGPAAEAAETALLAYPPPNLEPVLTARGRPGVRFVRALAALGDQRAFSPLRALVRQASSDVRAEAALALTRLGHFETVELARHWMAQKKSPPDLRMAAARILAAAQSEDRVVAMRSLLEGRATRAAGLELALAAPSPALLPTLKRLVASTEERVAAQALAAIGRGHSTREAAVLAAAFENRDTAPHAAYALGSMPGEAADDALEKLLVRPGSRALALRALAVRWVRLRRKPSGAEASAERALQSKDPADRAAAALALAVFDPDSLEGLLSVKDAVVVRGAARAVLLGSTSAVRAAATRLATERDPLTVEALALALATKAGRDAVPTRRLVELFETGNSASLLAALAIAERNDSVWQPTVLDWLERGESWLRAHVALGLGQSEAEQATSWIADAYRFEPEPVVRRATVVALAGRQGATATRALQLAAALDPDPGVRTAARLAIRGRGVESPGSGAGTAWFVVQGGGPGGSHRGSIAVLTPAGLALPLVPDPDGVALALGFPEGPIAVRVAATRKESHSAPSGSPRDQEDPE